MFEVNRLRRFDDKNNPAGAARWWRGGPRWQRCFPATQAVYAFQVFVAAASPHPSCQPCVQSQSFGASVSGSPEQSGRTHNPWVPQDCACSWSTALEFECCQGVFTASLWEQWGRELDASTSSGIHQHPCWIFGIIDRSKSWKWFANWAGRFCTWHTPQSWGCRSQVETTAKGKASAERRWSR